MTNEPDPAGSPAGEPADGAAVGALWPALFDARARGPAASLPARDADLGPFARAVVPGPAGPTWPGRARNLGKHFRGLEPEFAGRSRIAHLMACSICLLYTSDAADE